MLSGCKIQERPPDEADFAVDFAVTSITVHSAVEGKMARLKEAHDGVVMSVGVRRVPWRNFRPESATEGGKYSCTAVWEVELVYQPTLSDA